jgi:hypothetical protein
MSDHQTEELPPNVTPLKNSFREELEAREPTLAISYTMEVRHPTDPSAQPERKVFTIAEAKITETLNVQRRLLNGPPPNTRLVAFTIIPKPFSSSDVLEHAHVLTQTPLAKPFFNETNQAPEPTKAEIQETASGIILPAASGGGEDLDPSGVASTGSAGPADQSES